MDKTCTGRDFSDQLTEIFGDGIISVEISPFAINQRVTVKIERRLTEPQGQKVLEMLKAVKWVEDDEQPHPDSPPKGLHVSVDESGRAIPQE